MKAPKRRVPALAAAVTMLAVASCSDDRDPITGTPIQVVEAELDEALQTTVVPLASFIGAMADLIETGGTRAAVVAAGTCPDTGGWCASGTVSCVVSEEWGLQFNFDECQHLTGDLPLTVDGNLTAHEGDVVTLALINVVVNNSSPLSGTATIDVVACSYVFDINSSAFVSGTMTFCDIDEYPTGEVLMVSFHPFVVTIYFDGSSIASATATQGSTPVATCTIDLDSDPLSSDCQAI